MKTVFRMASSVKFSKHKYIEYQVGNMNVILSVPHGGDRKPESIPPRIAGYLDPTTGQPRYDHASADKDPINCPVRTKRDTNTIDLALHIANEMSRLSSSSSSLSASSAASLSSQENVALPHRPHVVICRLHRSKIDMNCDKQVATFGVPAAAEAWEAYHGFIQEAKQSFRGTGLFLDIHGQKHPENWVELGYTLNSTQLNDKSYDASATSIRYLANRLKKEGSEQQTIEELIYGLDSFGGMLLEEKYKVVPSPTYPGPGKGHYYTGGYNTRTHGSRFSGIVDGIQIESPSFLREKRMIPEYSKAIARTVVRFMDRYYPKIDDSEDWKEDEEVNNPDCTEDDIDEKQVAKNSQHV